MSKKLKRLEYQYKIWKHDQNFFQHDQNTDIVCSVLP